MPAHNADGIALRIQPPWPSIHPPCFFFYPRTYLPLTSLPLKLSIPVHLFDRAAGDSQPALFVGNMDIRAAPVPDKVSAGARLHSEATGGPPTVAVGAVADEPGRISGTAERLDGVGAAIIYVVTCLTNKRYAGYQTLQQALWFHPYRWGKATVREASGAQPGTSPTAACAT
jgi:hypothetical protein